jgi:hypothetical protein
MRSESCSFIWQPYVRTTYRRGVDMASQANGAEGEGTLTGMPPRDEKYVARTSFTREGRAVPPPIWSSVVLVTLPQR